MPIRVQLSRRKGWRLPPNSRSVARPTGWGNPYQVAPAFESHGVKVPAIDAAAAVQLFRERMEQALAGRRADNIRAKLAELRGLNLACWCALDQPCHADVLLELANEGAGG